MSQTALIIPNHLGSFEIGEIPVYTPSHGQLLIKVHAAALNPADWKLQKTGRVVTEFPAVLGLDRAGEVVEVGDGVVGFEKGDRVVTPSGFIENKYQGFQQYAIADAQFTSKIPPNVTYDQAATLPVALSTAISGFFAEFPHGAGLAAPFTPEAQKFGIGKTVVILGGAASVGQFAIQSAQLAGFSTIIATASLKNEQILKSQGATHVLHRSLDSLALIAAVSKITSNQAPHLVYDSIGISDTEKLGIAVAAHWHDQTGEKGLFVSVDPSPSEYAAAQTTIKVAKIFAAPKVPWNSELLGTFFHDKLYGLLENGGIKPNDLKVVEGGLAAIPKGLDLLASGQVSAQKLVVHPQESNA